MDSKSTGTVTNIEQPIKEEFTEGKKRQMWWSILHPPRRKIYNFLIAGKTMQEIVDECHIKRVGLDSTISHPYFLTKLEAYLRAVFFNYQVNRVMALDEVFKYLWNVGVGKRIVDGLSQAVALKHLIAIMSIKASDPKVINPKQYNFILNILKSNQPELKSMAKEFGFEGLENKDEESKSNFKLDTGETDKNE